MSHQQTPFPYHEIRDDVVGGNGDYFESQDAARSAGYDDDQIWSVTHGVEDTYSYGPPWHYVNLVGFIATEERHDNNTYYEETFDD